MIRIFPSPWLIAAISVWLAPAPAQSADVRYFLDIPNPESHYLRIRMEIEGVAGDPFLLALPAWSPGRYEIVNFARNVSEVSAMADGRELTIEKTDKQTWAVETGGAAKITVGYRVFANELDGAHSQVNDVHAFIRGAGVFMHPAGLPAESIRLTATPPPGWMILSAAGELGQTEFEFESHGELIGAPIQMGNFFLERFAVENTMYRLCVVNDGDPRGVDRLLDTLKKLQTTAVGLFGPFDSPRYTYFFHFLPGHPGAAAMESRNAFQISRNYDLRDEVQVYSRPWAAAWIAAHELFHAWNVKRLRPAGWGPFDLSRENYTELLWFAEGITSYFADLIIVQSGVWQPQDLYNRLEFYINDFRNTPGRFERSVEDSGFDTWLWAGNAGEDDWNNVWVNYYIKGELIGLCMDFEIRHRTRGRKSLVDVFNGLYGRFYENAEPSPGGWRGAGFDTQDLLDELERTTGTSWTPFYETAIASPGDLPLEHFFSLAGLELAPDPATTGIPYTGLNLATAPGGYPRANWIAGRSPAAAAGLMRHDIILALDGERTQMGDFEYVLKKHAADGLVRVSLMRGDRLIEREMTLDPGRTARAYKIRETDDVPPLARRVRREWLGGG